MDEDVPDFSAADVSALRAGQEVLALRADKARAAQELCTVLNAKVEIDDAAQEARHASDRASGQARLAARLAAKRAGGGLPPPPPSAAAAPPPPPPALPLPEGLAAIVGEKDAAWLAAERAAMVAREAEYDGVDGCGALFGGGSSDDDDDDDDDDPSDEAGDGAWASWAFKFQVSRATAWEKTPLVYHTSARASGHGDVVWCAAEYLAIRLLAHGSGFDVDVRGKRVLELGAGCGLPSLAACRHGADVLVTDNAEPGAIFALAASARWSKSAAADAGGSIRARSLPFGVAPPLGPFDVVLCADIVYDPASHGALLATLAAVFAENADAKAVVAFAFHGNAKDDAVLAFFDIKD